MKDLYSFLKLSNVIIMTEYYDLITISVGNDHNANPSCVVHKNIIKRYNNANLPVIVFCTYYF